MLNFALQMSKEPPSRWGIALSNESDNNKKKVYAL